MYPRVATPAPAAGLADKIRDSHEPPFLDAGRAPRRPAAAAHGSAGMKHLGKIIGAIIGFWITHTVWGTAIGMAIGAAWDEGMFRGMFPRARVAAGEGALVAPLFGLAGALAKSDGRVSEAEVDATEALMARMDLAGPMRESAIHAFNRGKQPGFDTHLAARELRDFAAFRGELKLTFIEVLAEIARADGAIAPASDALLRRIGRSLDVADATIDAIVARGRERAQPGPPPPPRRDPYAVLGLTPECTDREIRKAYQRLIAQVHPDKIAARGASPEQVQEAHARAAEINAAYEQLRLLRAKR